MENTALLTFINEACKQDDSDIDVSIAELDAAINTLKKEKAKREHQRRQHLIDDFIKAYQALVNTGIKISYDFNTDYAFEVASDSDSFGGNSTVLEMDDIDHFIFD